MWFNKFGHKSETSCLCGKRKCIVGFFCALNTISMGLFAALNNDIMDKYVVLTAASWICLGL